MFEAIQNAALMSSEQPACGDVVIYFDDRSVLVRAGGGFPTAQEFTPAECGKIFFLGKFTEARCFAARCVFPETLPPGLLLLPSRQALAEFSEDARTAFCRGRKLLAWRDTHRYCGVCRSELQESETDPAMICPACGERYYPQLAPAVIVAITRNGGRELLLAHNRNFKNDMYSLIAGFVEAGETVEAAVRREVMEECKISVGNIRYFTSQVWPFPNSLMLAFTAEYVSGTAVADGTELSDLGWFTPENHPQLPAPGSVARRVIDHIFGEIR